MCTFVLDLLNLPVCFSLDREWWHKEGACYQKVAGMNPLQFLLKCGCFCSHMPHSGPLSNALKSHRCSAGNLRFTCVVVSGEASEVKTNAKSLCQSLLCALFSYHLVFYYLLVMVFVQFAQSSSFLLEVYKPMFSTHLSLISF